MKVFFETEMTSIYGWFMIVPVASTWQAAGKTYSMSKEGGSFHLLLARVLGLSYADTLRFLRDKFDGRIKGRKGYAYVEMPDSQQDAAEEFLREINRDLTLAFDIYNTKEE